MESDAETASEDWDELSNALYTALAVNAQLPHLYSNHSQHRCSLTAPITFHDRHIDERLQLKHIEHLPLNDLVAHTIHITLQSLKSRGISLPAGAGEHFFSYNSPRHNTRFYDAPGIATTYQLGMATFASNVASMLLLDLQPKRDCEVLLWKTQPRKERLPLSAYTDAFGLEPWVSALTDELRPILDPKTRALFERPEGIYPVLAWWEVLFLSEDTDALIKAIGGDGSHTFDQDLCQTSGFRPPPVSRDSHPTADASVMPWGMSLPYHFPDNDEDKRQPTRRSLRLKGKTRGKPPKFASKPAVESFDASWPDVTIPDGQSARPLADLYTMRAWARAVENDTSFMVFYNGKFERIGLRHRGSQTLFLSPVIDVANCIRPFNGHIHTGLFLSIVREAADRLADRREKETRKRRRDVHDEGAGRQYKTRAANVRERNEADEKMKSSQMIKRHAADRSLVLLEMRYGMWNSPTPSAFVRSEAVPKTTYTSREYMLLVLTSMIAQGATGVAHTARLEILVSGQVSSIEVVVKIAFDKKQIRRLRHEYEVYKHLYAESVREGIPYIFGLFDDVETGAAALVMSHEGTCLLSTPVSELSEETKSSFVQILGRIHQAGVRHRDIRLQNLTLGDDGRPVIIDFDRAKVEPYEIKKKSDEMKYIKEVMRGGNDDPWMSASTPSKESFHLSDDEGPEQGLDDEHNTTDDDRRSDMTLRLGERSSIRGTSGTSAALKSSDSNTTPDAVESIKASKLPDDEGDDDFFNLFA